MFAHKPLCSLYSKDVLIFNGIHLCRSCTFVYLGFVTSLFININPQIYVSLVAFVVMLSSGNYYKKFNRMIKDLLRYFLGFIIMATLKKVIALETISIFGFVLLIASYLFYFKKRKSRKLNECNHCHEKNMKQVCSGFREQVPSIKHYENELTKMIYKKRGMTYEFK